jgi:hypothetical protein
MAAQQNKMVFTQTLKTAQAVCTAAKTTYNDTTNAVLLLTAGADGALLKKLTAMPRATVAATQLQLYISKDGGTTLQLIDAALMSGLQRWRRRPTIHEDRFQLLELFAPSARRQR